MGQKFSYYSTMQREAKEAKGTSKCCWINSCERTE